MPTPKDSQETQMKTLAEQWAEEEDNRHDDEEPDDDSETCKSCGVHIFSEEHDWDCPYAGEDEDDE